MKMEEKLICPYCFSKLNFEVELFKCENLECGKEFPIVNGIPIIINDEKSIFSTADYLEHRSTFFNLEKFDNRNLKQKVTQVLKKLIPSISLNLSYKQNFELLNNYLQKIENPKILIIGGGIVTAGTYSIYKPEYTIISSDVSFAPETEIILDAHSIPYEGQSFDCIIYQAVLQHVVDPFQCIEEAYRVLKKDGIVFASTPFMIQVHGGAYDFTRFSHLGLRRLFRRFNELESGVFAGTGVALAWSLRYFFESLFDKRIIRHMMIIVASFAFFWLKYFDYLTFRTKGTYKSAAGFYFIGTKSVSILSDKDLIKLYRGTSR